MLKQHRQTVALLLVLAGLAGAATATAGSFQWSSNGPWGGPISTVASAPSQPQVMYAASPYGYVYRSIDGGLTWQTRHYVAFTYVNALAVDPTNPDRLYAGTVRSLDGGASWTGGGDPSARAIAIDSGNPNVLYAGGGFGDQSYVVRSGNGGYSWDDVTHGLTNVGINAFVIRTGPESDVLVGTSGGIFRSTDSGASWNPSDDGLTDLYVQAIVGDPANPAVLYAGTGTGGVFKSADGGASWAPSSTGLPGLNVYAMLVSPGAVFAAVSSLGIYRTTDGGAHWTLADSGIREPVLVNAFAVGSASQDVFAGTPRGLYRTSDLGGSWATSHEGLAGNIANSVSVSPSSSLLAAGMGTGLFLSSDDGRSWTDASGAGLGLGPVATVGDMAFDPQHESTMFASVYPGVYKTTDAGLHWSRTSLTGATWDLLVDPNDSSTVYAGTELAPFKSPDAGGYWGEAATGIPETLSLTALALDPNNPQTLFAATTSLGQSDPADGIYRSTDGAATWQRSSDGLVHAWTLDMQVAPSDSQRIYTSSGFVSTDGGSSWTSMGMGGYAVAVDPTDALTVYVGTMDEGVFRSRDGGLTWQNMSIGLPSDTVVAVYSLALGPGGSVLHAGTTRGAFSYSFSFEDVLPGDLFYEPVRTLALNLLTTGCGNGNFCPAMPMTRAQAAVLLLRAARGPEFQPPGATGAVFTDVPAHAFAAAWIEEAVGEGITGGCGGGNFCPGATATRAQMAVFLLRAKHGPKYAPPPATGLLFADVPADAFAAAWIEALANEGISSGCGGGNFCPNEATSRGQAAALLVRTFGLE